MTSKKNHGKLFPLRGEIFWASLDPTQGNETKKRRPCLIISNDFGNEYTNIVIIAPITSNTSKIYPTEIYLLVDGKDAKIMVQQCRAIDKSRLDKKIQMIDKDQMEEVEKAIRLVFAIV